MKKINPKIEKITVTIEEVTKEMEHLIIYDSEMSILNMSENKDIGSFYEVEYDGIIYLADNQGRISIDYDSLINKFDTL